MTAGTRQGRQGAWERRFHQLVLRDDATPAQRLAWLEEMIKLAFLGSALARRDAWVRRQGPDRSGRR